MGEPGFPQAFAEALEQRGVSLAWLHERLVERGHPVSSAALSYWRSGRSQPERGTSRDALVEIERLLWVEPGRLVDRLGPSRRPGPRPGESAMSDLFDESPAMQAALQELGFESLYDELVEQLRHITVDLDAEGRATVIQVKAVMVARRDGARRTPLIVTLDDHGELPVFVPVGRLRARHELLRRHRRCLRRGAADGPRAARRRVGPLRAPGRAADTVRRTGSSTTTPHVAWPSCSSGCGSTLPGGRSGSSGSDGSTRSRRASRSTSAAASARTPWRAGSGPACSASAGPSPRTDRAATSATSPMRAVGRARFGPCA